MTDYNVLEERDGYRVCLLPDDSAEEPYNDGATPILTVESARYGGYSVEAFNKQADEYVSAVSAIMESFGDLDVLERYLRIFHGTVKLESFWSDGIRGYYVAFDTAQWRESVGAPIESLQSEYYLEEVQAWANGEVYGYIVERNVACTKTWEDGTSEDGAEWVEVEDGSLWGLYGWKYADEAARQALTEAIEYDKRNS